jgi:ABC-2 type transport system ATP-binding protein
MTTLIAPEPTPAVVELRGLVKRYGSVEALRGLDLTVEPGQVYGFLGRNGAGKSTTLRIIMGITLASGGAVTIFGQPLRGEAPAVRRRIGYVAQEQSFYGWMTPLRLGQFVRGFYPTWDDAEYQRLLGLLEIPPGRRIATLSGGTSTKLGLAVALAHRPALLVLDEPTAGMDAVARREFIDLVRAQAQRTGRTTLFSSHLIDEVEMAADTIGIVDGGRMLWQGPTKGLQQQARCLRYRGPGDGAPALPDLLSAPEAGLRVLEDRADDQGRTLMISGSPAALAALATAVAVAAASAPAPATVPAVAWEVVVPSLEDVFVAMVRRPIAY